MNLSPDEILELLSTVIDLEATSSTDGFRALCPFPSATHPSFYVNTHKGVFYCFGCGEGGTIRKLFRKLRLTDAILPSQEERKSVREVLQEAQKFFRVCLLKNPQVRAILRQRNRERFIDRFALGYAPNELSDWRELEEKVGTQLLIRAGLYSQSGFPILRHRITIPIRDEQGSIVAFSGRAVDDNTNPKYIHSYNTLVKKGSLLFGLDQTAQLLANQPVFRLFVTEGYFDAMHLISAGIPAVAVAGASMTAVQVRKIIGIVAKSKASGLSRTVYLSFDPDKAGLIGALSAAVGLLAFQGELRYLVVRIVITDDRDIDEYPASETLSMLLKWSHTIPQAFAKLVLYHRPSPETVARLLVLFPSDIRATAWRLLQKCVAQLGTAYLQAVHKAAIPMHRTGIVRRREVDARVDLWNLLVAAVVQGNLTKDELGDLVKYLPEILHPELSRVLRFVLGEDIELSDAEERLYARLTIMPVPLSNESLIEAALKARHKLEAIKALQEAVTVPPEKLEELRAKYLAAMQALQSLEAQSERNVIAEWFLD